MAIHAMEARGFHSKPSSYSACRPAGRMAIHAMEAKGFHMQNISTITGAGTKKELYLGEYFVIIKALGMIHAGCVFVFI